MFLFVVAVMTALVVSFSCSIFESVLLSLGHAQVEILNKKGKKAGRILEAFKREMERPIAAILILNTIAHTVGAGQAGASFQAAFADTPIWVFHVTFTLSVLLFTEIVPKTLGIAYHRKLAVPVAHSVHFLVRVLRPVLVVTNWISRRLTSSKEVPVTSIEEIRILASAGRSQGVLGPRTAGIIEGAAVLRELKVDDVMVPRNRVAFLDASQSRDEVLETIRQTGFSRFPFTRDGDPDHVEGVVLAKEMLLQIQAVESAPDWSTLVHEPLIVPETKTLHELLRTIQDQRRHLAVVVDEYGGVAGIVTLEDVLEEIVGEIVDESDREGPLINRRSDGSLSCSGLAELRKVTEELEIEVAETEVTTLSGFVAEALGRVPVRGDVVEKAGLRCTVARAGPRRAVRVILVKVERDEGESEVPM